MIFLYIQYNIYYLSRCVLNVFESPTCSLIRLIPEHNHEWELTLSGLNCCLRFILNDDVELVLSLFKCIVEFDACLCCIIVLYAEDMDGPVYGRALAHTHAHICSRGIIVCGEKRHIIII
jgi:hypothetical protein